jgi:nucleoside-diphosphate-sugar epimerase
MAAEIARALGDPAVPVRKLPWWIISLASRFSADLRELQELRYLWERPVRLNNARLLETLGHEPRTPLADAVRETLAFLNVPVADRQPSAAP